MPALVLARVAADQGHDVVLVGAARGIEAQILPRHPFRFHLLPMEPFYRRAWWRNLRWPLIAARAWRAAGRVLQDERPAIVIGTGGYAAGPVVWRAQNARIPTALQEQNAFPGLTQRWLARRAQQIHLGFPEARLGLKRGRHTQVFVFFNPIGVAYAAAHVAVARAGAMTVSELCAWGKPSVLVPLPTAAADHQTFNARALANAGASVLLLEREFTPDAFAKTVVPLAADENRLDALARSARGRGHPNAARSIMEKVLALSQVE